MATFTGTAGAEIITPGFVSPTVAADPGGSLPSDAADIILAEGGADNIDSGGGADTITGGDGDDFAVMGGGDDTFIWRPGDDDDTVEGGTGTDTLDFFGSNGNEETSIFASGSRATFTRNLANITMDLNDVETIVFRAFGGVDIISVNDLTGTDVNRVDINLEGALGSGTGDAASDVISVNGTAAGDTINISDNGTQVAVTGLPAQVNILNAEAANDGLTIMGHGGNDTISASGLVTALLQLFIDAGDGNDAVTGSNFADQVVAGDGNDFVDGGRGDDVAFLGAGDDSFLWNPGDGSDVVEGQDGADVLVFNGSDVSEVFNLVANGGRVLFTRNVANIVMDMDDVESLQLQGLNGTNDLTIGDLSGTDMTGTIFYSGGTGVDTINAAAAINAINALGGDGTDVFTTSVGTDTLSGDAGADILNSGAGADLLIGGAGADALAGGSENDLFRYVAGSDAAAGETVNGQGGTGDALQLIDTGSIDFRVVSISDVEQLLFLSGSSSAHFNANQIGGSGVATMVGGTGADTVSVTGSTVDLSALTVSSWSDAIDTFHLFGTIDADTLSGTSHRDVLSGGAGVDYLNGGLGDDTYVLGGDADNVIDSGGTDSITSTVSRSLGSLPAIENLTLFGTANINGSGNGSSNTIIGNGAKNILIGRAGNDSLSGGSGNDVLIGSNGRDLMKGGVGSDRFDFNTTFETGRTPGTRDKITDFKHGQDRIDLSTIDANGSVAGNGKFSFLASEGAAFTGVRGQLRWDQQNNAGTANDRTIISADVNGNGRADFQIELTGLKALTASDFVL